MTMDEGFRISLGFVLGVLLTAAAISIMIAVGFDWRMGVTIAFAIGLMPLLNYTILLTARRWKRDDE